MPTLIDLVDEWIIDNRIRARRGFSKQTERAYRNDVATFARVLADTKNRATPPLDDQNTWPRQTQQIARLTVQDLTDTNVATVFGVLIERNAAASSRGRMLSALRGFSGWLCKHNYLKTNPTEDFETPQVSEKLPVAFTEEQVQAIVDAAASPDVRLRAHWPKRDVAMLGVLIGCGLRSSELTDLTIAGIEQQEPYRVRVTGKGQKDRVLPLSKEVLEAVHEYLKERQEKDLGGNKKTAYLFVRNNGEQLNNQALQNLVKNWLGTAGVPLPIGEKVHAFRHTYAVAQLDYGTNPAELQTLLGHKNLSTTSQYLRLAAEGLHHTAQATAVNAILRNVSYR